MPTAVGAAGGTERRTAAAILTALIVTTAQVTAADTPVRAVYVHLPQCIDVTASAADQQRALRKLADDIGNAGFTRVVPYVSTTSGEAHYPTDRLAPGPLLIGKEDARHDPVRIFLEAARRRNLEVLLCVPVLACGHARPAGILRRHPDWALRDLDGVPIGSISPGHPEARRWVTDWLAELVDRYRPDGVLLDYMRFSSLESQLDDISAARLASAVGESPVSGAHRTAAQSLSKERVQEFRERLLSELMHQISGRLRGIVPELHIAIYSWGHHVTSGHRVAQAWPQWAARGDIDEINVCGYWYPDSWPKQWGDTHLAAFRTVLTESRRLLDEAGASADLTFALGVRTSHGEVKSVRDIAAYLNVATDCGADGVTFFTWSSLTPFLPQLRSQDMLTRYAQRRIIPDHPEGETSWQVLPLRRPFAGTPSEWFRRISGKRDVLLR